MDIIIKLTPSLQIKMPYVPMMPISQLMSEVSKRTKVMVLSLVNCYTNRGIAPGILVGQVLKPGDTIEAVIVGTPQIMSMEEVAKQEAIETIAKLKKDPNFAQMKFYHPPLYEAVVGNNINKVSELIIEQKKAADEDYKKNMENERIMADPNNPEGQRLLLEKMQKENVMRSYEKAMEENPELFGEIVMLYVSATLNNKPLTVFVDTGAQMTIISQKIAEEYHVLHLMDRRFQGIASGVGQGKILGRIHAAELTLGGQIIDVSLTVLENSSIPFILGLDNMKRHQCCVDLKENCLKIGSGSVPFLSEGEIPKKLKRALEEEEDTAKSQVLPQPSTPSSDAKEPNSELSRSTPSEAPSSTEEKIAFLLEIGFSREQAIQALSATKENVDEAASLLLSTL
eukprot:TRINITY_DN1031_c0_g1_i2.p1 TRINITY_DN1031_c0_g1~~TRINITY_DN1031_c0_g1_i2.p1  ORF type:complete len:398 (+),score=75.95 TRINITY_DN1031_c0_g1_i2:100-1293(+)